MPRSQLSETFDRLQAIVNQILALNEEERGYVLDQINPLAEPDEQPKQKRVRKKRTTKSERASGMASAIKQSIQRSKEAAANDAAKLEEEGPLCGICGHGKDYQDHFKPSPNYHEPELPKKAAA